MSDDIYITLTEADPIYIVLTEADPIYITLEGSEGALPAGTTTGDIIRYNDAAGVWEVAHEPFEFKGLVLTPALVSLIEVEGALYYNSTDKVIKVCTAI